MNEQPIDPIDALRDIIKRTAEAAGLPVADDVDEKLDTLRKQFEEPTMRLISNWPTTVWMETDDGSNMKVGEIDPSYRLTLKPVRDEVDWQGLLDTPQEQ